MGVRSSRQHVSMTEPESIKVSINDFSTDRELELVEGAFDGAQIPAQVERNYMMKSADLVPWIVSITVAHTVGGFVTGFFGKLGSDAAVSLKTWVHQLREARRESPAEDGSIVIRASDGTVLVIGDPPDIAFQLLVDLDWDEIERGYLLWDDETGQWLDRKDG